MAVTVYYKPADGQTDVDARVAALGAALLPDTIPQPATSDRPCIVLWSDALGVAEVLVDNNLDAETVAAHDLFVRDALADAQASETAVLTAIQDTNAAYLAIASPTAAQVTTQVRVVTELAQAFIALQLAAVG
jgi:hypothetical protein